MEPGAACQGETRGTAGTIGSLQSSGLTCDEHGDLPGVHLCATGGRAKCPLAEALVLQRADNPQIAEEKEEGATDSSVTP